MTVSSVATPAGDDLSSAVRPLIRAVVRRRGSLYQPVYFGPLDAPEPVVSEVRSAAEIEGVEHFEQWGEEARRAWSGAQEGVVVLSVDEAIRFLSDVGPEGGPGHQVVVWGDRAPEELPDEIQGWVFEGLALDPSIYARPPSEQSPLGPTLTRLARDPGRVHNPVLLFAPAASVSLIADEVALRLDAGGFDPIATVHHRDLSEVASTAPEQARGGALIVRLPSGIPRGEDGVRLRKDLEAHVAGGRQVVVVVDMDSRDFVTRDLTWARLLDGGVTLAVSSGAAMPAASAPPASVAQDGVEAEWPALSAVAPERPRCDRALTSTLTGATSEGGVEVPDMLQTIAMGGRSGRFVVYRSDRLGWLDVAGGAIRHADHLNRIWDPATFQEARRRLRGSAMETPETLGHRLIEDRAASIALWPDTRFSFVYSDAFSFSADEEVEIAPTGLSVEAARRADEWAHRAPRLGGLGRVWRAKPSASAPESEWLQTVLALFDGSRTVYDIVTREGILVEELFSALWDLLLEDAVEVVEEREVFEPGRSPVHQVVRSLYEWGLVLEAREVIDQVMDRQDLSLHDLLVMATLVVDDDVRDAWAALDRALSWAPAPAPDDAPAARYFSVALFHAVLGIRRGVESADLAWNRIRTMLSSGYAHHARTPRHVALLIEIAYRAGARDYAGRLLEQLTQSRSQEAQELARALSFVSEST